VPAAELVTNDRVAVEAHLDVGALQLVGLVTHNRHLQVSQQRQK
jgi:hypothetical protein